MELIGVDLGNVIIDHVSFGTTKDYVLKGNYNFIPSVPGVFAGLKILNTSIFKNRTFVVYNATDVAGNKIISWL